MPAHSTTSVWLSSQTTSTFMQIMAPAPGQTYIFYRTFFLEGIHIKAGLSSVFLDFFAARNRARAIQDGFRRKYQNAITTESLFLYTVDAGTCMYEMSIHTLYPSESTHPDERHEMGYIVATRSSIVAAGKTGRPSSVEVCRCSEYDATCVAAAVLSFSTIDRHVGTSTSLTVRNDANGLPCWTGHTEFQTAFVVHVLEKDLDEDGIVDEMGEMIEGLGVMGLVEQTPRWDRR